jgi:hypothetical protein
MAKTIRAARHYQRDDDPILRLSRSAMLGVARDLREAFANLGEMVPVDKVKHALEHGAPVAPLINFGHFREVLKAPFGKLTKLHNTAAELGVRRINAAFARAGRQVRFRKDVGSRFNFDALDDGTQTQMRQAQDNLIQQLDTGARDSVEAIVAEGARYGTSIADMADNIRDMIGLTDTQAQAVMNFERMLTEGDPAVLTRALRNPEYDAIIQDSIDAGTDLNDAAIDNMVDDYVENYLDYRAATIAQTEATRTANVGLHNAYRQAIDRGALTDEAVTRQWLLGDHPCPICESIPDNNPDGVGVDEAFDSDDGPIDDPPVHPSCECSVDYVTDLTQVPDEA